MTAKYGILQDYDLMANHEPSAQGNVCVVCGADPVTYQWSDRSGEAMCTQCGTPYQLKWGSETQETEGAYPYLLLRDEWVPVVKRYYEETGAFAGLGTMLGEPAPGYRTFFAWVDTQYPDGVQSADG